MNEPGGVKTRFAAALGAEWAARLHRLLADKAMRRTLPRDGTYRRTFLFAPADAEAEVAAWLPGERLAPQSEGDLGRRMAAAFEAAFADEARRVIVVGTDAPSLSERHVREALAQLEAADVVLARPTTAAIT